jgi:putative oxidoreductase
MVDVPSIPKRIPSLVWYAWFEPYAYAFMRFSTGALIFTHGASRLFYGRPATELGGFGHFFGSAVGPIELVGGAMLALGLFTRLVAILFTAEWLLIAIAVAVPPGKSWLLLGATPHYPAMVALFCFSFVLRGGGQHSMDRTIGKEF